MIYIITAMYAEAHAFIERFHLKKDPSHTRFQVFQNTDEGILLVISGTGPVPAAVAAGSILTQFEAGEEDFLINAGICAGIRNASDCGTENLCKAGEIFLGCKIREKTSGRTFYPDLLYRHEFREAQIVTGVKPYDGTEPGDEGFYLYDMEAAAVYQAGAFFLGPHQMSFLKVISDDGNAQDVTSERIRYLMDGNMEGIADYIARLQSAAGKQRREEGFLEDAQELFERLCADLHCSRVMSEALRQHMRYFVLAGADFKTVIEELYREGKLPCKDKREGKQRFEELRERLL